MSILRSQRKLWEALKTSNDALFPFEYNGKSYSGVPGAAGVRFDNLLFDVVVVPHGVADAFMVSPRSRHLIATSAVGTDDLARARRG